MKILIKHKETKIGVALNLFFLNNINRILAIPVKKEYLIIGFKAK